MKEIKVLYIAYFFPPLGGGGVQRTLKFVKYFPQCNIKPIVLTVNENTDYRHDESLLSDVPAGTIIERTPAPGFSLLNRIGKTLHITPLTSFLVSFFGVPDPFIGWYWPALRAARKLIAMHSPDVIVTTSSPFTAHLVGLRLQKEFPNIKWVVDFRDEWSSNPWTSYPTPLHKRLNQMMERKVLTACDLFVAVTPDMATGLLTGMGLSADKGLFLPNGFDEKDFEGIPFNPPDRFTITYAGSIYGDLNPKNFFAAVRVLQKRNPELISKIRINFFGNGSNNLAARYRLTEPWWQDVLRTHGYVPHRESIAALRSSSMLLLIIPSSRGPNGTSGRIFEHIASGVPIFGMVDEHTGAAKILHDTGTGYIIPPDNVEKIADSLANFVRMWQNQGRIEYHPNESEIAQYSRIAITKRFSDAIRTLVSEPE